MAEVGGAVLGYAVSKLLDEVLVALRHLNNRSANLLQLQNLLERLQPSVKELSSSVQDEKHPAGKWLTKLGEELEKSHGLVNASGDDNRNILRLYKTSKKSLEVYHSIHDLLVEASTLQWASGLYIQRIPVENAEILVELRAAKEREETLLRTIANLSSKGEIVRTISKLDKVSSFEVSGGSSSSAVPTETVPTQTACPVPKPKVTFAGEAVANELISHLLNGDCKKWVGLWGMGGIGKTFTASKVYHDSSIQRHFSGGIFWLTVSKDQPGPMHLFKQLLEKVRGRESVSQLPDNLETAKSCLKSILDRDRVLLVLDDVWQEDVLDYLDVIPESKQGVILVTFRDQGILRGVIDLVKIFEIPRLSPEDSWQLFNYHAFGARERVVPSELEAVAKSVAEECKGLPLALEVIGATMGKKELVPAQKALGQTTLREWEIALERLRSATYGNSEYEALYLKLQLSVDSLLEQDPRLQDCFFYFAAFQEDEKVDIDDLVQMWIAEGLVQDDLSSSFSGEEEGRVLLGFLVAKSMIEVTREYGEHYCKVHDVMRDLAQRNLKRNFATGEEIQTSARVCLYAPGVQESNLPKEWTVSTTPSSARRLSLQGCDLRHFPEPEHFQAPQLQVLILSMNTSLQSLSTVFFQNLSNLRVLDLSLTGITSIPGALLRRLKSLVLLDLRGCHELREVSDEINSLHSLEFLLLRECEGLQKLPRVNNLTKLKRFDLGADTIYPRQDDKVDARDGYGCGCWRGWRSSGTQHGRSRGGIPYVLPASLRRLKLSYDISLGGKYSFDLSSLCALEDLDLSGTSCPAGMGELHHLKKLSIWGCYGAPVFDLGKLPMLEDLSIIDSFDTECYACEGAFACLKRLHISFDEEKMFTFHRGAMPNLESLTIMPGSEGRLPTTVTELRSLRTLLISHYTHYTRINAINYTRINGEDLEVIFKQSDCFPRLESLTIEHYTSDPVVLPGHMLARETQGKLTIKMEKW